MIEKLIVRLMGEPRVVETGCKNRRIERSRSRGIRRAKRAIHFVSAMFSPRRPPPPPPPSAILRSTFAREREGGGKNEKNHPSPSQRKIPVLLLDSPFIKPLINRRLEERLRYK